MKEIVIYKMNKMKKVIKENFKIGFYKTNKLIEKEK
jgi:hypothetical protein